MMNLVQKIEEACGKNSNALVVCEWYVGMPRKEPRIVETFIPELGESPEQYAKRKNQATAYADAMNTAFAAQRKPFNGEQAALLVLAPELVPREPEYFVANAEGLRVY